MELKFDISRKYAVVLEGGGAKGAYQAGVWKALAEAGVQYHAVAGTSVGALNGAMMAAGELDTAIRLWENMTFSQVFDADDAQMKRLYHRELNSTDMRELLREAAGILKEGGLDIAPLRQMIREYIREEKIRQSDVKFFFVTYSLTDRKEVEVSAQDLEEGKLADMLLASAYVPVFQRKKLDGRDYIDGSVRNILPLDSLLKRGYRDIIAIRIYGVGIEKRTKIPSDANIITIAPTEKLGGILQFDAESTKRDLQLGYFDGLRTLYGLAGETYYIDRKWSEMQAYFVLKGLLERRYGGELSLREMNEEGLPGLAKRLHQKEGTYHELLLRLLEKEAKRAEISPFSVRTEEELLREILKKYKK